MSFWLVPLLGIPSALVYRAWRREAALRSGELMDLRDLLPSGIAEIELRALAERRYRLELQFEAVLFAPDPGSAAPAGEADEIERDAGRFPFELSVLRADGELLYAGGRPLEELFRLASKARDSARGAGRPDETRFWGSVPLLDLETPTLGRLRFDFAIQPRAHDGRIEKAQLLLKEDVRPLSVPRKLLDCVQIEAATPNPFDR